MKLHSITQSALIIFSISSGLSNGVCAESIVASGVGDSQYRAMLSAYRDSLKTIVQRRVGGHDNCGVESRLERKLANSIADYKSEYIQGERRDCFYQDDGKVKCQVKFDYRIEKLDASIAQFNQNKSACGVDKNTVIAVVKMTEKSLEFSSFLSRNISTRLVRQGYQVVDRVSEGGRAVTGEEDICQRIGGIVDKYKNQSDMQAALQNAKSIMNQCQDALGADVMILVGKAELTGVQYEESTGSAVGTIFPVVKVVYGKHANTQNLDLNSQSGRGEGPKGDKGIALGIYEEAASRIGEQAAMSIKSRLDNSYNLANANSARNTYKITVTGVQSTDTDAIRSVVRSLQNSFGVKAKRDSRASSQSTQVLVIETAREIDPYNMIDALRDSAGNDGASASEVTNNVFELNWGG